MKNKAIVPTDVERLLPPGRYIVSSTDTHGRITEANDMLVEFSGYSLDELLHAHHNIIRHPSMPRSIFWLAWDTLQSGEDFSGYFRNLSRDGSFYWVFAHITPEYGEDGKIKGYRSVRRTPKRSAVLVMSDLYADMLAAEREVGTSHAIEAGLAVLGRFLATRGTSYEKLVATL